MVLQGHYSAVTSLCLAPDGWSLISGGRDKVVHVWDLRNNTKLVTIPVYEALEGTKHSAAPFGQLVIALLKASPWSCCMYFAQSICQPVRVSPCRLSHNVLG